jgi:hypothetical protein
MGFRLQRRDRRGVEPHTEVIRGWLGRGVPPGRMYHSRLNSIGLTPGRAPPGRTAERRVPLDGIATWPPSFVRVEKLVGGHAAEPAL